MLYAIPTIAETRLSEIQEERRVVAITTLAAWEAAERAGLYLPTLVARADVDEATEAHFQELGSWAPAGEGVVVYGIGGGLAADAAKYVAWMRGLPLVMIPTALSVDAHLTWASGVRRDGCVAYLETMPANLLYADYALLAQAPASIRAAGICDLLSIATGLFDWRYAEEHGRNPPAQRYIAWAAQQAQGILDATLEIAAAAGRGDPDGLRDLLRLLALEVQLCNLLGHSRPEEGSEHYLAYALEAHPAIGAGHAHGDLVGPAILRAAAWQGQNPEPLRAALVAAGVPLDRVPPDALAETERDLPAYVQHHGLAFGIAHDLHPS